MTEVKWSCGCHEVDGKLVQECTQVSPVGDLASHQLGRPFAAKCFRKAAIPVKPVGPAHPIVPQN